MLQLIDYKNIQMQLDARIDSKMINQFKWEDRALFSCENFVNRERQINMHKDALFSMTSTFTVSETSFLYRHYLATRRFSDTLIVKLRLMYIQCANIWESLQYANI